METIKEENKADLEQLLNSLIEKGWLPRGEKVNKVIKTGIDEFGDGYVLFDGELNGYKQRGCNMVELVSKSSGLWQFVCENGMVRKDQYTNTTRIQEYEDERDSETYRTKYDEGSYLFRIIQSSLKDESELEDFLLNSIKID